MDREYAVVVLLVIFPIVVLFADKFVKFWPDWCWIDGRPAVRRDKWRLFLYKQYFRGSRYEVHSKKLLRTIKMKLCIAFYDSRTDNQIKSKARVPIYKIQLIFKWVSKIRNFECFWST